MWWYSQRDSLSRAAQASLPKWAAPAAHKQPGGPESFSGIETAHSRSSHNLLYSGASRAGMASAHSATPPPPSTPKSPSPDQGAILRGGIWAGRTLPGGAGRRRKHPCSLRGPKFLCNVSSVVLYGGWVRAGPTCPGTRGRVRVCVPSDASRHQAENNGPPFKDI
jgi:hypothetical protein